MICCTKCRAVLALASFRVHNCRVYQASVNRLRARNQRMAQARALARVTRGG
jgi:hypothetical protein